MDSPPESLSNYLSNNSITLSYSNNQCIDGKTCLAVISYAMKFHSNFARDMILHLDGDIQERASKAKPVIHRSEFFKKSFVPRAYRFFQVPNVHDLLLSEKKENEVLAGFLDFLLQLLNSEANMNTEKEQRYAPLQKELTYLLSFLGDTPFQYCTTADEVLKELFAEFQRVANEAGDFIHSCIFVVPPITTNRFEFDARSRALFEKVQDLNALIEEHCTKFSERTTLRTTHIDSLFIVDSLLEDLENVIQFQSNLNVDNHKIMNQIKSFHQELTLSQPFLWDIEHIPSQTQDKNEVKDIVMKIRDVAYEAEYLINSHVVGNIPDWYLSLRLPDIIQKIKVIGVRLHETDKKVHESEALRVTRDFGGQVSLRKTQPSATPDDLLIGSGESKTKLLDDLLIGSGENKTNLLDDLVGGSENLKIISIFGMPGVGKTTIANKLYNDSSIIQHFDQRAWCVVSQEYQKRKVLINILMGISRNQKENEALEMHEGNLGDRIFQTLMGRRYLIVMDDVWHIDTWFEIKRHFPDDGNGSRIMLTSRIKDSAPTDSIFHPIPLLSKSQCWKLLQMKLFHKQSCPPHLQYIGKRIAEKCNGLPLAIVVTAGILATREKEESAWEEVERNLDSRILDVPGTCMKLLELSYDQLPNHLKLCFLYLAIYPEDAEIPTWKLKWLWIAEGFVKKEKQQSPEHVAERYLLELINRSLLLIDETRSDGGIKSCRIHDLLREMCMRKAQEEYFVKFIYDSSSIYETHRRLCVRESVSTYWRPFGLHCRSFSGHLRDLSNRFPQMPLLRVMDLLPTENSFIAMKNMHLLVHLRYLSVGRMRDSVIGNFTNLEFLCIKGRFRSMKIGIPSHILKMVKLRHLQIKNQGRFVYGDKWDLDCKQSNLKYFSYVCIDNKKDEEILGCWPHLAKLKCKCEGELFPDLSSFIELESLTMVFEAHFSGDLARIKFPSTIKKLSLKGLHLPWGEMSIVGRLPNLNVLKLLPDAFVGEEWKTNDGEFQELQFLKLDGIKLRHWVVMDNEHFPKLQVLALRYCEDTQMEIPSEIGNIPTLKMIKLRGCSNSIKNSAALIEQELHENGIEELKVVISGDVR